VVVVVVVKLLSSYRACLYCYGTDWTRELGVRIIHYSCILNLGDLGLGFAYERNKPVMILILFFVCYNMGKLNPCVV